MYSKKRPLNNSSGSQEASPIASPKGEKNNFSTTPKSSGKKHKKRKLIQKLKKEKVKTHEIVTPPNLDSLNETSLPEKESDNLNESSGGDSTHFNLESKNESHWGLAIGMPLKTSTPHTKTKDDIASGRKNDTDISKLLSKMSISKTQKDLFPEVINSAQLHIDEKHTYFEKGTPQYLGYSPKINKDNQTDITSSQRNSIQKITRETNALATASQSVLKQIENLKSNEILTEFLSCVEIDHLTQTNRFSFWNSVLLHDSYLKLPKIDDPSFDTYCHNLLNFSTFLRTKLNIAITDLQRITKQVNTRASNTQASITFSYEQAKKATGMLKNKVRVASVSIDTAINGITGSHIGYIDPFSKAWLKLITSQLGLMKKEMSRNIYFGGREPALGDLSLETFLREHRQPSVVVNSALYWLNSMILFNSMLMVEGHFVLNAAGAQIGLEA